jgi:hypothetical protein
MFDLLFVASIIGSIVQIVKEACTPTIPAENWANKELIHRDRMSGMSEKEILRNVDKGRYRLPKDPDAK